MTPTSIFVLTNLLIEEGWKTLPNGTHIQVEDGVVVKGPKSIDIPKVPSSPYKKVQKNLEQLRKYALDSNLDKLRSFVPKNAEENRYKDDLISHLEKKSDVKSSDKSDDKDETTDVTSVKDTDAREFMKQNPDRSSWSSNAQELEAALLSGAQEKYVVRQGKKIIAAIAYERDEDGYFVDHLGSMVKGHGSKLMNDLKRKAVRDGVDIILTSSIEAEGFYQKLGFKQENYERFYRWSHK
jgi:histone acetyltransferase (RNA polymerase elongator complex component)